MSTSEKHRLSDETAVVGHSLGIILYDRVAGTTICRQFLTDAEMETLIAWYRDGCCSVCGTEINHGEIVCDSCYEDASRFPARADQANARATKQYTYSAFAHAAQINLDRLLFYRYITTEIKDYQFGHTMTYGEWLALWTKYCEESWKREALIQAGDARDQRETQNVACDRYDDGDGIRFDPHLDAYIG